MKDQHGVWRTAISIHALREEGDGLLTDADIAEVISIHALREEGDSGFFLFAYLSAHFYPRPP